VRAVEIAIAAHLINSSKEVVAGGDLYLKDRYHAYEGDEGAVRA